MYMPNHGVEWYEWVLNELLRFSQWFNTLISLSATVGRVAYTFVYSVIYGFCLAES